MLRVIVIPGKHACNLHVSSHMIIHKPDKFSLQMMLCLKEMGSTHIHNNHNAKSFIHHNTASVVTSQRSCNMQGQNNCHQNAHICSDALWSSAAYWHFRIVASWSHNRPYVMAIGSFFINLGRLFWNVKAQDYIDCGVVCFVKYHNILCLWCNTFFCHNVWRQFNITQILLYCGIPTLRFRVDGLENRPSGTMKMVLLSDSTSILLSVSSMCTVCVTMQSVPYQRLPPSKSASR